MANSKQAKKRARQSEVRRKHNASLRSRMRTHIKRTLRAIESGDAKAAEEARKTTAPVIDGMVTKGLIHRNKAARYKSRLNKHIREIAAK